MLAAIRVSMSKALGIQVTTRAIIVGSLVVTTAVGSGSYYVVSHVRNDAGGPSAPPLTEPRLRPSDTREPSDHAKTPTPDVVEDGNSPASNDEHEWKAPKDSKWSWPPPRATFVSDLPSLCDVDTYGGGNVTLFDVQVRLTGALTRSGYDDFRWYPAPRGFALVTRVEQISDDGAPLLGPARWAQSRAIVFSISGVLSALFKAQRGRYRAFIFAVAADPMGITSVLAGPNEFAYWNEKGAVYTPTDVGNTLLTPSHRCAAFTYEFYKAAINSKPEFVSMRDSTLTGVRHLMATGVVDALRRAYAKR